MFGLPLLYWRIYRFWRLLYHDFRRVKPHDFRGFRGFVLKS